MTPREAYARYQRGELSWIGLEVFVAQFLREYERQRRA